MRRKRITATQDPKLTRCTTAAMANAELISEAVLALLEPRLKAVELGLENNFKAITAQIKQSSDNIESKLETVDTS